MNLVNTTVQRPAKSKEDSNDYNLPDVQIVNGMRLCMLLDDYPAVSDFIASVPVIVWRKREGRRTRVLGDARVAAVLLGLKNKAVQ